MACFQDANGNSPLHAWASRVVREEDHVSVTSGTSEQLAAVTAALAVPGVVLDVVSSAGLTPLHIVCGALGPFGSPGGAAAGGNAAPSSRRASISADADRHSGSHAHSEPRSRRASATYVPGASMVSVEVAKKLIEVRQTGGETV